MPALQLLSHPLGQLPFFAVMLKPGINNWNVFQLSERLRSRGWLVPAYAMPADCEQIAVLRFVVRAGFTCDMADQLLVDLEATIDWFQGLQVSMPEPTKGQLAFHH
jgi:glutamate decarboxylase